MELNEQAEEVVVHVEREGATVKCPQCGQPARRYDTRRCRWRHPDTCEYRTILVAQMPRVLCKRHNVKQVGAPWAENSSRFTMRFEAQVIDWRQEATTARWPIGTPRSAGSRVHLRE